MFHPQHQLWIIEEGCSRRIQQWCRQDMYQLMDQNANEFFGHRILVALSTKTHHFHLGAVQCLMPLLITLLEVCQPKAISCGVSTDSDGLLRSRMGNKNDSVIDLESMTFLRKDGNNEGKTHRHKNRLVSPHSIPGWRV